MHMRGEKGWYFMLFITGILSFSSVLMEALLSSIRTVTFQTEKEFPGLLVRIIYHVFFWVSFQPVQMLLAILLYS